MRKPEAANQPTPQRLEENHDTIVISHHLAAMQCADLIAEVDDVTAFSSEWRNAPPDRR